MGFCVSERTWPAWKKTWFSVPAITRITVSVVGLPLPDFLINVSHNFSDTCSLSPPVYLTGRCSAAPGSPARGKLRVLPYRDDVAYNRRRRRGKVRLSLRTHTSLGCVRTEPALVICTGEVSALTGKRGRDQCNCRHFINELWETFINCRVLLRTNTQLHDGTPLVPVPSTGCSKIQMKQKYFPFIRLWRERKSWAGLSEVFPQPSVREAEARAQRGR